MWWQNADEMKIVKFAVSALGTFYIDLAVFLFSSLFFLRLSLSLPLLSLCDVVFLCWLFLIMSLMLLYPCFHFFFSYFCIRSHFHSFFLKNGFLHEEKSSVPGSLLPPWLCLINMYVATVLVTKAMMGSFLSLSDGVWYVSDISSADFVFCLRICATLSPRIRFWLWWVLMSNSSKSVMGTRWTLGAHFQRLFLVAYSEIWKSGSWLFRLNTAIADSKPWIVLIALGDLEICSVSSLFLCTFCSILAKACSKCACSAWLLAWMASKCLVLRLDGIVFSGTGVGPIVEFGPLIAEIWARVGSSESCLATFSFVVYYAVSFEFKFVRFSFVPSVFFVWNFSKFFEVKFAPGVSFTQYVLIVQAIVFLFIRVVCQFSRSFFPNGWKATMKKALLSRLNRIYYWWYFGYTLLITILN